MNFNPYDIFHISNDNDFNKACLETFHYQYNTNIPYQRFVNYLHINPTNISHYTEIPCMPVEFFKNHRITSGNFIEELEFHSSGTTGKLTSKHFVKDKRLYETSLIKGFEMQYGDINEYAIFALLPSYMEQKHSSLIHMVETLINTSSNKSGGFYLYNHIKLINDIKQAEQNNKKILLWGVTYALLDLAEKHTGEISNITIIETGGMKGRRKEITREELHQILNSAFKPTSIDSEYGMTELLSQAWAKNGNEFACPPWMKVLIRDTHDPRQYLNNRQGLINVIDLANYHSCSFLEINDIGKFSNNGFQVLGRFDQSDIRGCNLMVE